MKIVVVIIKLFKHFGLILRGLGLVACLYVIFQLALPDLLFNMTVRNVKTYTEQEIAAAEIKDLPRFLKISDVYPMGETYVKIINQSDKGVKKFHSIVYPVYSYDAIEGLEDDDDLSGIPCYIVVENSNLKESEIDDYLENLEIIEGKFDNSFIDSDVKKILEESGYTLSEKCILIKDGESSASTGFCVGVMLLGLFFGIFIVLSFLPLSIFERE